MVPWIECYVLARSRSIFQQYSFMPVPGSTAIKMKRFICKLALRKSIQYKSHEYCRTVSNRHVGSAAEMGMRFLKAGAAATEAVEAALRILEDKEITNAGYGSNLSIDGTVECDATIVDHLGRSGACGAVPSSSLHSASRWI